MCPVTVKLPISVQPVGVVEIGQWPNEFWVVYNDWRRLTSYTQDIQASLLYVNIISLSYGEPIPIAYFYMKGSIYTTRNIQQFCTNIFQITPAFGFKLRASNICQNSIKIAHGLEGAFL